jgi:hypothetical protein
VFAQTVGYPDPDHSEEVGAFVVVDAGEVGERELLEYAAGLGIQKRPKKLVLLRPEDEAKLLKYTGPGKPQRLANTLTFWRFHFLDEAAALLAREGILPSGARAVAVPDDGAVGLLVCATEDGKTDLTPRPPSHQAGAPAPQGKGEQADDGRADGLSDLWPHLVKGSRLSEAELERQLRQRGLAPADLKPSRIRIVRVSESELAEARSLNRARLVERYWS